MKKPKSLLLKKILAAKAAGKFDPDAKAGPDQCKMVYCGNSRETEKGYCMECEWTLTDAIHNMVRSLDA